MGRHYLDFNATAPVMPEVLAAVVEEMKAGPGNPSSPHREGRRARAKLWEARAKVAELVGAACDEVVFTAGGTEANVAGIWGALATRGFAGVHLILSAVEHPSLFALADQVSVLGVLPRTVPVSGDGLVLLDRLREALIGTRNAVVVVQAANSETGVLQDLEGVAAIVRAAGGHLHCDGVQAAGKTPIEFREWGIDSMSVSAHKIGGPPGVGALSVRTGVELGPLIPGSQENHRRGGTENVPGAVGFGVAAEIARRDTDRWIDVAELRDVLEEELRRRLLGCRIWGDGAGRLPNTTLFGRSTGPLAAVSVAALDLAGFAVSSGPACSSGVDRGSRAVMAMGGTAEEARLAIRVSLGQTSTLEELEVLMDVIVDLDRRSGGGVS